ncbi:MauE/DoxX family redox-associated membrane protein [Pedobacter ureilyticus]|uniref:MauE/DoxX family redox-associated membrane protein n=1 Tax=Pedobacter ureilyticus TaxID=1393051 RepID=A0ABW9J8F2_9SPHI|nr:MauE/DoxX family redox-associated membrane protein [Pedobacter helvus]
MNHLKDNYRNKAIVVNTICTLYFLLFLYAAASKLISYDKSELQLAKSPITTDYASTLVWLVPTTEIIIAILLIPSKTRTLALYVALAMMSMFSAYIYAILNYSSSIPCSCGGVLENLGWDEHLLFNIFFMILAVLAILLTTDIHENKILPDHKQEPIPV